MEQNWFENESSDRARINGAFERAREALKKERDGDSRKDPKDLMEKATTEFEKVATLWNGFYEAAKKLKQGNDQLVSFINETRRQLSALQREVENLSAPPLNWGTFHSANDDGTVNVLALGRKVKVNVRSSINIASMQPGQEVLLNDSLNVISVFGYETHGIRVVVKELLEDELVLVTVRADEDQVGTRAGTLRGEKLKIGDHLMMDNRSGFLIRRLPKAEIEDLALEEVPDVSYADIGGLDEQIEAIHDAIELPYLYPDHFRERRLTPPKGVLLYGPPGCGKTMIAKAVANDLAKKVSAKRGESVKGFFLNIKGPELLDKYVGETERKIREVFIKAKEKASEDVPVIIFFDEMDALFRTRGTGISSDIESTIVPQLLSEIDGVEGLRNIVVIGASNRQDLIDPAVLRPGRLDVKIRIDRPTAVAALKILAKYSTPDLPLHSKYGPFPKRYETPNRLKTLVPDQWAILDQELAKLRKESGIKRHDLEVREMAVEDTALERARDCVQAISHDSAEEARILKNLEVRSWAYEEWEFQDAKDVFAYLNYKTIEGMYVTMPYPLVWVDSDGEIRYLDTRFLEATYANGDKETLYHKDFVSGAMLESIVRRAKKRELKRHIATDVKGLLLADYREATREEFKENADLPNTANPDDWAKIQGKKGERIVYVKPLSTGEMHPLPNGGRDRRRGTDRVTTGQYL